MSDQEDKLKGQCHDEPIQIRMLFDALIEEYRQLCEFNRTRLQRSSSRANVLTTISFAILAYTIGSNITTVDLLVAAAASIFLYFTAFFDIERALFYSRAVNLRIRDIESEIQKMSNRDTTLFTGANLERMRKITIKEDTEFVGGRLSPVFMVARLVRIAATREIRSYGLYFIVIIWIFRII